MVSLVPSDIFSCGSRRERKNYVLRKYFILNLKNICVSPSTKTFTLSQSFVFSTDNNCNFICEGDQLLMHVLKPTIKEEKVTQYDVITLETVLV